MSWHDVIVHVLEWNFNQHMNEGMRLPKLQDENSREPMLISLLLYTQFKININLIVFWFNMFSSLN